MLSRKTGQEDKSKMKQLGTSIHKDMTTYLQDFGFGGFLGYGSGVPGGMMSEEEELMRRMMYDG